MTKKLEENRFVAVSVDDDAPSYDEVIRRNREYLDRKESPKPKADAKGD